MAVRLWGPRTPSGYLGQVMHVREPVAQSPTDPARWGSTSRSGRNLSPSGGSGPHPQEKSRRVGVDRGVQIHVATGSRGPGLVSEVATWCAIPDLVHQLSAQVAGICSGGAQSAGFGSPPAPGSQAPGRRTPRPSGQGNSRPFRARQLPETFGRRSFPNVWAEELPGLCRHTSQRLRDSCVLPWSGWCGSRVGTCSDPEGTRGALDAHQPD
jgi:hypothetical protein